MGGLIKQTSTYVIQRVKKSKGTKPYRNEKAESQIDGNIVREYYEHLYVNKFESLGKMNKCLERYH